jgi:hypothetical protein
MQFLGLAVFPAIDPIRKDVTTTAFRGPQVKNMQQVDLAAPWRFVSVLYAS